MAFYDKYPYTDFHELNLDWIIEVAKKAKETADNTNAKIEDVVKDVLSKYIESGDLDKLVEDAISKLSTLATSKSKLGFISSIIDTSVSVGDCSVISGNKNIIIDIGSQTDCADLINYLRLNNITKIDYLILSHYHNDHIGGGNAEGLLALLSSPYIDHSNLNVLLPHKGIEWGNFIGDSGATTYLNRENKIKELCNQFNVTYYYPNDAQSIELGEFESLTFYNIGGTYYSNYYNVTNDAYNTDVGYTNYNNFSMVVKYKHLGNNVYYTGDIEQVAESLLYPFFIDVDLLKVEHHGLNYSSNRNYLNQLTPSYGVVENNQYYNTHVDYAHDTVYKLYNSGTNVFATRWETTSYPTFESSLYGINNLTSNHNTLSSMNYNLFSGTQILENEDLNAEKFIVPGVYFCRNGTTARSLLNAPVNISGGSSLLSGFRMLVLAPTVLHNTRIQFIATVNDNHPKLFFRTTIDESFINSSWTSLYTGNQGNLNNAELDTSGWIKISHSGNSNRVIKRNSMLQIQLNLNVTESVPSRTDIIVVPSNIAQSSSQSMYFCGFINGTPAVFYTNYTTNGVAIRSISTIPSGATVLTSCTLIDETII